MHRGCSTKGSHHLWSNTHILVRWWPASAACHLLFSLLLANCSVPRELLAVGWEVLAALGGPCSLLQSTCTAHLTLKLCSFGASPPRGSRTAPCLRQGRTAVLPTALCVSLLISQGCNKHRCKKLSNPDAGSCTVPCKELHNPGARRCTILVQRAGVKETHGNLQGTAQPWCKELVQRAARCRARSCTVPCKELHTPGARSCTVAAHGAARLGNPTFGRKSPA